MTLLYEILGWVFQVGFILSAILLIIVVLLQEGKGGGIAEAFGGMGGETFGVRASGITKFTGWVAFVFMGCALLVPITDRQVKKGKDVFQEQPAPGNEITPPPGGNTQPPK